MSSDAFAQNSIQRTSLNPKEIKESDPSSFEGSSIQIILNQVNARYTIQPQSVEVVLASPRLQSMSQLEISQFIDKVEAAQFSDMNSIRFDQITGEYTIVFNRNAASENVSHVFNALIR